MGGAGVVATPDNFELFYAYASGENPAVSQVMGADHRRQDSPSPPELLADLRLRCLSGARAAATMESLGGDMAQPDRRRAGQAGKRRRAKPPTTSTRCRPPPANWAATAIPADVRKLVEGLIAATRAMEQRTKALEGELQASSRAGQRTARQAGRCAQGKHHRSPHPASPTARRSTMRWKRGRKAADAERGCLRC